MQLFYTLPEENFNLFFTRRSVGYVWIGFIGLSGLIFAWITTAYADPTYALQGQPIDVNEYLIPDFFGTISVFLLTSLLCPIYASL